MRVLVADDEVEFVRAIARGLRREGYAVDEAFDGAEALRKASEVAYDLICLDLTMPAVDGLTVGQLDALVAYLFSLRRES